MTGGRVKEVRKEREEERRGRNKRKENGVEEAMQARRRR